MQKRQVTGLRAHLRADLQTGVTSLIIRLSDTESKQNILSISRTAAMRGAMGT
jgi:hypothetical protein